MIESPNYTQIPNVLLDEIMQEMTEAELRVCLAIMRNTFGWQRQSHKMSLSYLQQATGLSRQGVLNGIESGINRGIICKESDGASYRYSLTISEYQSTKWTSQRNRLVNEVDHASQRSRPLLVNEVDQLLVNEVDTTKKSTKKKKNKENRERKATFPPNDLPAEESEPQQADNQQQNNQLPQRTHPNAEKISAYMNGQPPPPRQNWRRQQTGEHLATAAKHGVDAKQFHALVNALLDATGNRALADADGPEADRALSKAKEAAVTAASLGIKTPEDVQARAKAFAENHPAEWVPHYGQLLKQRPPDQKPQAQLIAVPARPPIWAG